MRIVAICRMIVTKLSHFVGQGSFISMYCPRISRVKSYICLAVSVV